MSELTSLLDFAIDTAFQAGKLTLGYFQTKIDTEFKKDDSPVTIADKKAEAFIRSKIENQFPNHDLLGEEFGEQNTGASYRWIIDPIDGTKSFMRGVPLYGVLIGLERDGEIILGVTYFPGLDELVYASKGQGCFWNGRRCFVSKTSELNRAVISFTDFANFEAFGRSQHFQQLSNASYYRVGWSDAYGHMLVATGRCDMMLDPIMNPWDCGPFPVILKEAGGYFGSWQGQESIYANEALSCNPVLLQQTLELWKRLS